MSPSTPPPRPPAGYRGTDAPPAALARATRAPAPLLPGAAALPPVPAADRAIPEEHRGAVADALSAAWSQETHRAYRNGWERFARWCAAEGRQALPAAPETVLIFINDAKGADGKLLGLPALQTAFAAIGHRHRLAGIDPPPTALAPVKLAWKGVRTARGARARNAKAPITLDELRRLMAQVDRGTLRGKRDAALLLVGFAMAGRRSEITALHAEHVLPVPDGLSILIARSKTDQEGAGQTVGIAAWGDAPDVCPVKALGDWTRAAGIREGPIFRAVYPGERVGGAALTGREVARAVKRYASLAGLPVARLSGHSLRRGHVTEAYRQGIPEAQIQSQTRHTSATMLRKYREEADPVRRGSAGAMKPRKS